MWKLNSVLLNNRWVKEFTKEIIYFEMNENENMKYKNTTYGKSSASSKIYSYKSLFSKRRQTSNSLSLYHKKLDKNKLNSK